MGGAGLMVTGGIAPNRAGTVYPMAAKLTTSREARSVVFHRVCPTKVRECLSIGYAAS